MPQHLQQIPFVSRRNPDPWKLPLGQQVEDVPCIARVRLLFANLGRTDLGRAAHPELVLMLGSSRPNHCALIVASIPTRARAGSEAYNFRASPSACSNRRSAISPVDVHGLEKFPLTTSDGGVTSLWRAEHTGSKGARSQSSACAWEEEFTESPGHRDLRDSHPVGWTWRILRQLSARCASPML
jgi:hypothetical protein